jgi:seryl-tRNA synthetase
MLDPKLLRNYLEGTAQQLARRGFVLENKKLKTLEALSKAIQTQTQELQAQRNSRSKGIGKAKAAGEDIAPLLKEVEGLGEQLKAKEQELAALQEELNAILMGIPNIPHASVPAGTGEADNPELRKWGEPPQFDFEPRDHVDLGEQLGQLDFETAAKLTGSRFSVMRGPLARLHRGLIQFMLASSVLHQLSETTPSTPENASLLAEVYYLLGLVETTLSRTSWTSETEFYLETAIRQDPKSGFARDAYMLLEEYLILGYTGSAGVNLPEEVETYLWELQDLIDRE